jgi:protein-tyrosine phosphatase
MTVVMRILFVCTGNICRSPMAEAVMRKLVDDAHLSSEFTLDSAGIGGWHAGEQPQPSAVAVGAEHGYDVEGLARQVQLGDFADFDLIVAMDRGHQRALRDVSLDLESRLKVRLLLDGEDVPDPYGGPRSAYELVLSLLERGCRELLTELTSSPF